MKRSTHFILAGAVTCALVLVAVWVLTAPAAVNQSAPSLAADDGLAPGPQPVTLTLKATRSGSGVRLTGTTNLPNGAVIVYEVQQVNGAWITDDCFAKVKDGRYCGSVEKAPTGKLEAWTAFAPMDDYAGAPAQPRAVIKLYGGSGEKIPNGIAQYGGTYRVEATAIVH